MEYVISCRRSVFVLQQRDAWRIELEKGKEDDGGDEEDPEFHLSREKQEKEFLLDLYFFFELCMLQTTDSLIWLFWSHGKNELFPMFHRTMVLSQRSIWNWMNGLNENEYTIKHTYTRGASESMVIQKWS